MIGEHHQIILAAIALGFTVSDHDELKCTHNQLIMLAAMIAQEAIRQDREETRK
jgi:hypothetical protein